MATTPQAVLQYSQETKKLLLKSAENALHYGLLATNTRSLLEQKDRAYYREQDKTREQQLAKAANNAGNAARIQNVVVPVVMPQVESLVAYFTDTFLSSYPIFPVLSKPDLQDEALEIETILGESSIHFQWPRHFNQAFRDGAKYNLMAVEVDWEEQKVWTVTQDSSQDMVLGTPVETVFAGNKIKRLDPYNLIFDRRVPPAEVHIRGDYVGYVELLTRIQLKNLFLSLDRTLTMDATAAFESGVGDTSNVHVPHIVPETFQEASTSGTMNWEEWLGAKSTGINYSSMYEVLTLYRRIIPKEFGIGGRNSGTPQIYKFLVVNNKTVIYIKRMTNAHNFLPIIVSQLVDDGLGLQTKSFADNAIPYQQLASSLYNSGLHSQRKKVYDRMFYDPSRINPADMSNPDPIARIAVKSEAYGKPLAEAVYVVPYRDEGVSSILQIARDVTEMADIAVGQNRVSRGQFQKGNKTRYEFDTVMTNSDARQRMYALMLETSFLQPIKHILKMNILQYQTNVELYNRERKQPVTVNPADLRTRAWEFQMADGILPADKLVDFNLLGEALQLAMAAPALAAEWDIMGIFMYSLKVRGARWVNDFRRTPEQAQQLQGALLGGTSPSPPTE